MIGEVFLRECYPSGILLHAPAIKPGITAASRGTLSRTLLPGRPEMSAQGCLLIPLRTAPSRCEKLLDFKGLKTNMCLLEVSTRSTGRSATPFHLPWHEQWQPPF